MTIAITGTTSGGNDKGTATWVSVSGNIPLANFAVGDWVIAAVAADSTIGPKGFEWSVGTGTFSDFTTVASSNKSGYVSVKICIAKIATKPSTEGYLQAVGMRSGDSKAGRGFIASGLDSSSPYDKSASSTGSSTSPSSGATATLSQADELAFGAVGTEGPRDDTRGSFTTGTSYVSGNETLEFTGTIGGSAASNISCDSAIEIVSATTAQTAAKTGITSRDWAAVVATFKGAASGTTYNQSVSGSSTATGAQVRQANKLVAGSSTATSTLVRAVSKAVAGTTTVAGALVNQIRKSLVGSTTGVGTLARRTLLILVGSTTQSGLLVRRSEKFLSGLSTLSSSLSRVQTIIQVLSGSLLVGGSLLRGVSKAVQGSTTASGFITRVLTYQKTLSGSMTTGGLLSRSVFVRLSGLITISGLVQSLRIFLLSLSGSLTLSGLLGKLSQVIQSSSLVLYSSLGRHSSVTRSGTITSEGSLTREISLFLFGLLTMSGIIRRTILKRVLGVITSLGDLISQLIKVTPAGRVPLSPICGTLVRPALPSGVLLGKIVQSPLSMSPIGGLLDQPDLSSPPILSSTLSSLSGSVFGSTILP